MDESLKFRLNNGLIKPPAGAELVLSLSMEDLLNPSEWTKLFYRIYFAKEAEDGSLTFYRITDEPRVIDGEQVFDEKVKEQFVRISSFKEVVKELCECSYVADIYLPTKGEPVYVYYDIDYMHDAVQELFRDHLAIQLWTNGEAHLLRELVGWELQHIDNWKKQLLPKPSQLPDINELEDFELFQALANSTLVLSLQLENEFDFEVFDPFSRQYYKSELENGSDVYFLSTNERVRQSGFFTKCKKLGSGFTAFSSFCDVIFELNHFSEVANEKSTVHGPPKYIYYDPVFVTEEFAQELKQHLEKELSGYSEDYLRKHFTKDDHKRITYWKSLTGTKLTHQ